ncbi:MAG: phosphoribosyl-ATP diphosphatase [Spirochaetaceae bacterium]|nr:phosphoribosyl-ATP diphosphatase [Myxococcales bacterium]MCB9723650.1 phosphoribosyl-ATP diphosphatase [Spirochaetaceae bacterium]
MDPASQDDARILDRLFSVLETRRQERPAGSYVVSLLDGGIASIGAKVEEEAAEVIAAARDESDAAVAHEAADLLFHLWVLMLSRGVEPSRVYAELARRFGVGGLAEKAARGGQAGGGGR